jgi:hypothetical protein
MRKRNYINSWKAFKLKAFTVGGENPKNKLFYRSRKLKRNKTCAINF